MTLLKKTQALLERDRGRWTETAEATGLGYEWIKKLANNKIPDPGVNKIEKLNKYLMEKYSGAAA